MNTVTLLGAPIFCIIASFIEDVRDWKGFYYMCKKTQRWLQDAKPPLLINSHRQSWRGRFTSSPDTSPEYPVLEIWFRDPSTKYCKMQENRNGQFTWNATCERRPRFYNVCAMSVQLICQGLIDELQNVLPSEIMYLDSVYDTSYFAIFFTTNSINAICEELYEVIAMFDAYEHIILERKNKKNAISVVPLEKEDEWWNDNLL